MSGSTSPITTRSGSAGREARLRPMGPRGEGWIGIQMLLEVGALVVGPLTGIGIGGATGTALLVAGLAVMLGGVALFAWGGSHLGSTFSVWVDPRPTGRLVTSGPYRYTRHPICTAQVLLIAGWALVTASPVTALMVPVVAWYLDRYKLAREEQTLLMRYPAYADYCRAVPHRMLPQPPHAGTGAGRD